MLHKAREKRVTQWAKNLSHPDVLLNDVLIKVEHTELSLLEQTNDY